MNFEDACTLTADIAGIPFTVLENLQQCEDFCRRNQFHSRQDYLEPYVLEVMLDELTDTEIVCTNDVFQIHYIFCRTSGANQGQRSGNQQQCGNTGCQLFCKSV